MGPSDKRHNEPDSIHHLIFYAALALARDLDFPLLIRAPERD